MYISARRSLGEIFSHSNRCLIEILDFDSGTLKTNLKYIFGNNVYSQCENKMRCSLTS